MESCIDRDITKLSIYLEKLRSLTETPTCSNTKCKSNELSVISQIRNTLLTYASITEYVNKDVPLVCIDILCKELENIKVGLTDTFQIICIEAIISSFTESKNKIINYTILQSAVCCILDFVLQDIKKDMRCKS